MRSFLPTSLSIVTCALALLVARSSFANSEGCDSLLVEAEESVLRRYPDLPERIRESFAGRDGVDACVEVRLRLRRSVIRVEVTLSDGRFTTRSVQQRVDVIPTLEALLQVPSEAAPVHEVEAEAPEEVHPVEPAPPRLRSPHRRAKLVELERRSPNTAPEPRQDRFGIELSGFSGARIGDGQSTAGLGAQTLLEVYGWLLGVAGRVDKYTLLSTEESHSALEFAALGGRRWHFDSTSLDLLVGAAVTQQGDATVQVAASNMTTPTARREVTSSTLPRLLLASHVNFADHHALRGFLGLQAEFGASSPDDVSMQGEPPPMPRWLVGVALGATLGTR